MCHLLVSCVLGWLLCLPTGLPQVPTAMWTRPVVRWSQAVSRSGSTPALNAVATTAKMPATGRETVWPPALGSKIVPLRSPLYKRTEQLNEASKGVVMQKNWLTKTQRSKDPIQLTVETHFLLVIKRESHALPLSSLNITYQKKCSFSSNHYLLLTFLRMHSTAPIAILFLCPLKNLPFNRTDQPLKNLQKNHHQKEVCYWTLGDHFLKLSKYCWKKNWNSLIRRNKGFAQFNHMVIRCESVEDLFLFFHVIISEDFFGIRISKSESKCRMQQTHSGLKLRGHFVLFITS